MTTTRISVQGPYFGAAHAGLHRGRFEALHGHTFTCRLELVGSLDGGGMVADFTPVRRALAQVVEPLHRRTLMPDRAPDPVRHFEDEGMCVFDDGHRRFAFPVQDVVLLPVANTSTELIARYLLDQLRPVLEGVESAELVLAESPGAQAVATYTPGGSSD
ncbi:6-carboxytetrahydropterin synthase [Nocardiopsis sp. NPDC049922]|uniref:6-pyruvoyl trahydropterin synthase family protein n=1 Tax=Nocardiopsis sp. NPDC049922 TaxID=3155157 RepID=UPI0034044AAD